MENKIVFKGSKLLFFFMICFQAYTIYPSHAGAMAGAPMPIISHARISLRETLGYEPEFIFHSYNIRLQGTEYEQVYHSLELPAWFVTRLTTDALFLKINALLLKTKVVQLQNKNERLLLENARLNAENEQLALKIVDAIQDNTLILEERIQEFTVQNRNPQSFNWSSFTLGAATTVSVGLAAVLAIQHKEFIAHVLK